MTNPYQPNQFQPNQYPQQPLQSPPPFGQVPPPFGQAAPPPSMPIRERQKFGLDWWGIFPVLALIVVQVMFKDRLLHDPTRSDEFRKPDFIAGAITGAVIGGLLVSLLVSWIFTKIARGGRTLSTTLFTCMMCLFILTTVRPSHRKIDMVMRNQTAQIEAKAKAAEDAANEFRRAGGGEPAGIDAPGALERRLSTLATAQQATYDVIRTGDSAEADIANALRDIGVSQSDIEKQIEAFREAYRWPVNRASFAASRTIFAELHDILELLRAHRSSWRLDPISNKIIFDDTQLLHEFNNMQHELASDVEAQKAALENLRQH